MMMKLALLLGLGALATAQRCQNYWNGKAPFCAPGGCDNDIYRWWGIVSDKGDGGQCWTGMKRLCQCLAPGSLDACVPSVVPPRESKHLKGLFTTCNNGCSAYVCSVEWVKFWKREEGSRRRRSVNMRYLPCEEHPEQPHCQQPPPDDPSPPPPPPPQPTNDISSTPLSPDQVHAAFAKIEYGNLASILRELGDDTNGKSQADLVSMAWNRFEAAMGNLDLGQVDAARSLEGWEEGEEGWVYYEDPNRS
ncbi:MAG: hypothetical protein L6R37_005746 [Teloschistes peruensis]|nr:MAG: hypothetical protein L6R37_005746 [Teloschistes peruensis]